jgi:hypothetical protein
VDSVFASGDLFAHNPSHPDRFGGRTHSRKGRRRPIVSRRAPRGHRKDATVFSLGRQAQAFSRRLSPTHELSLAISGCLSRIGDSCRRHHEESRPRRSTRSPGGTREVRVYGFPSRLAGTVSFTTRTERRRGRPRPPRAHPRWDRQALHAHGIADTGLAKPAGRRQCPLVRSDPCRLPDSAADRTDPGALPRPRPRRAGGPRSRLLTTLVAA